MSSSTILEPVTPYQFDQAYTVLNAQGSYPTYHFAKLSLVKPKHIFISTKPCTHLSLPLPNSFCSKPFQPIIRAARYFWFQSKTRGGPLYTRILFSYSKASLFEGVFRLAVIVTFVLNVKFSTQHT